MNYLKIIVAFSLRIWYNKRKKQSPAKTLQEKERLLMKPAPANVIILNNDGIVNIEFREKRIKSHEMCDFSTKFNEKMQKITQKKEHSIAISQKLIAIGERNRGIRMKACNTDLQLYRCKCCGKTKILNAHLCRDRLCPTCQYLLSVKRYNQMIKTIDNIENKLLSQ